MWKTLLLANFGHVTYLCDRTELYIGELFYTWLCMIIGCGLVDCCCTDITSGANR